MVSGRPGNKDSNPDPVTGEPGFHPIGNVVGGIPGATVGAAIGAAGGPIGIVIGAAIGGLLGGAAGDSVAEMLNPSEVDTYWEKEYRNHSFGKGKNYSDVRDPIHFGTRERLRYGVEADDWEDVESDLRVKWEKTKNYAGRRWEDVRDATRAGYVKASDEIERAIPGDADRDGR
jgi:uncharacterized protein YcfJ